MSVELSKHELELMKVALPYFQEVEAETGAPPTQEALRLKLGCREASARRIQNHLITIEAVKVANRLQALPVRAEDKATVQYALGDTSGSLTSHVLRENARLTRALAKVKHERDSVSGQLAQDVREEIEALKAIAKEEIKRTPSKTKSAKDTGLMLQIAIADHHFGKLSWPVETGGAPYDLKIAEAMFMRALDTLLDRAKGYEFEQVLFLLGNDLLHANDVAGNTFSGTKLDTEGRFQKTYWVVRKAMCRAIEVLRQIAPVKVVVAYGNHDKTSMWTLADSLECFFHEDPRVEIDNQPIYRKYHKWGQCGLMFTHGDLGKRADYPLVFATERPDIFGSTTYREVHTGHLHTTRNEEFHGVRVRILPSLTPPDAWHSENSFVGNLRNAEAFVWSKTEGLIAQFIYSDIAHPTIVTKRELVAG
jgi:hypothetical protein